MFAVENYPYFYDLNEGARAKIPDFFECGVPFIHLGRTVKGQSDEAYFDRCFAAQMPAGEQFAPFLVRSSELTAQLKARLKAITKGRLSGRYKDPTSLDSGNKQDSKPCLCPII